MKNKLGLLSLLTTIGLVGTVSAQTYNCPMGGGMMYGQYGLGMGILGWLTTLAVLGLIAAGIYWLIKSANKKGKR